MFTNGHAQKYASRATSLAYSSVIFTRTSGPGGSARAQVGEAGIGCKVLMACFLQGWRRRTRVVRLLPSETSLVVRPESLGSWLFHFLDIRQRPFLLEERLLGTVNAEQDFELPAGAGGNPVRFLALGCLRAEIDVDRAVRVLLQSDVLRGAAEPFLIADERMSRAIVGGRGPVLRDRRVRRYRESIGPSAGEGPALSILDRHHVELACTQMLGAEEDVGIEQAAAVGRVLVGVRERA